MESKEPKQAISEELKDEQLKTVAGGNPMHWQTPFVIEPTGKDPFSIDPPVKIPENQLDTAKRENEVNIGLENETGYSPVLQRSREP